MPNSQQDYAKVATIELEWRVRHYATELASFDVRNHIYSASHIANELNCLTNELLRRTLEPESE